MSSNKNIASRAFASYIPAFIFFAFTFIQSIVLVPIFLKFWSNEKYGVWLTISAFVILMRTLDLGHQTYIGNEFSKLYHVDKEKARTLLGSSVRVALFLGLLELLVYVGILVFHLHRKWVGIDLHLYPVSGGIFAFLIMWLLVGSVGGIINRILFPVGLYHVTNYFQLIIKAAEIIALLVGMYLKLSINQLCILVAGVWLVYNLYTYWKIRKLLPEFFPWWQKGNWKLGLDNLRKSTALTVNGFIDQFNTNGLILLVSNVAGLLAVPMFTTIRTVGNTFMQVSNLMLNPLAPELVRFYVKGEKKKIVSTIEANWFITGVIINLPIILLLPFLGHVYTWWTKGKLEYNPILLYTLLLSITVVNSGKSFLTILTSINQLKEIMTISICRFITNYTFGYIMLRWLGLSGLGIGILLAEMISSGFLPAFYVNRLLHLPRNIFLNRARLLSIVQILLLGTLLVLNLLFTRYQYPLLPIGLILSSLVSWLQWQLLDQDVKQRLLSIVRRKK